MKKERPRSDGRRERRTKRDDGRIGRKARFVDSEPPLDSSHVHFPLSSRFPAVASTMAASHRAALFPPIDRETRNGDSLNLDPDFDGTLAR